MEKQDLKKTKPAAHERSRENSAQGDPGECATLQGHPDDSTTLQGHPDDSTTLQGHPDDSTTLQGHPDDSTTLQGHPDESTSLQVLQISDLIIDKQLKMAFTNIYLMEKKLLEEHNNNYYKGNGTEYARRVKDVDLLYVRLVTEITSIVKDSLDQAPIDEKLMASVVCVINEEAAAPRNAQVAGANSESRLLGKPRNWKPLWKKVIEDSMKERVGAVPIPRTENRTWLAEYLESLKTNITRDLLKVKNSLTPLYPEDYDVCSTYARCFHSAVSSHLKSKILPLGLEFSQLYGLLDWVMNTYRSDTFMDNPDLKPEVNIASLPPLLDDEDLRKLKSDYSTALQETIKKYLTNILQIEKQKWEGEEEPEKEILQDCCQPSIYIDIVEMIGQHVRQSAKLSEDLETCSFQACIVELGIFASNLESAVKDWSNRRFTALFVQYFVIYVNSFIKLRNNPVQSDAEASLTTAIDSLKQHFFHLFKMETQPNFQKLITRKWLVRDTAFKAIMKPTVELCQWLKYLIGPLDKEMQNGVHKYLVIEYITQIMKRKISLKSMNRKKAALKMCREASEINNAAIDLGSELERLFPTILYISEIIGLRNKEEIQLKLERLFNAYPDIGEEHILAILHLQGMRRRKKLSLLSYFRELQEKAQQAEYGPSEALFAEIPYSTQVTCFSSVL
ncbi:hypothetical protein FKM82_016933 [Ascaphus truei]